MEFWLCKASEVGKIVVNKCLERNIPINTQKLEKLLVLMQLECIERSGKLLFPEDIVVWRSGVAIEEVDKDFMQYATGFDVKPQPEYIALLDKELESVEYILDSYGDKDAFELNELPIIKELICKAKPVIKMIISSVSLIRE